MLPGKVPVMVPGILRGTGDAAGTRPSPAWLAAYFGRLVTPGPVWRHEGGGEMHPPPPTQ